MTLLWLGWWVVPRVVPDAAMYGILGGLLCAPAIAVWWAFFSRAPRIERWGAVVLAVLAMAVTPRFLHVSVAKGNMGFQFLGNALPVLCLAFVLWAVATRRLADGPRRATMVATILLACAAFTLVRSEGVTGDGSAQFTWRWSSSAEERLLTRVGREPAALPTAPAAPATPARQPPSPAADAPRPIAQPSAAPKTLAHPPTAAPSVEGVAARAGLAADWPGFRGTNRAGIVPGLRIATDWSASPPLELWRRSIGPGVSSFAVRGDLLYTQEQRGDDEIVACYTLGTGEPVWMHHDPTRFWDPHVGAGPRATPAVSDGRVYALGATGLLNALDAADGAVAWSRNVAADSGGKVPHWGFVSSPLVVGDLVVVHAGALSAYDLATGDPRWSGPKSVSYSSPHLLTVGGVPQILMLTAAGAISVAPADGALLWEHAWPGIGIVQPALTAEGDVLISQVADSAQPIGMRRLAVVLGPGGWTAEERWTSNRLKPSFSPIVVHEDHVYGFDGGFLACIDVLDGQRKWKGGRYGSGQMMLLPDQDLLLVVSEEGELALVAAAPDEFKELARFQAIEGKTWNQPALVGDVLLVRNGQEMAAFRLAPAGR